MQSDFQSYSSGGRDLGGLIRQWRALVRLHGGDVSGQVAREVARLREVEERIGRHAGIKIEGLRMLDVGAGQRFVQMRYFTARGNDVVGIDRDMIVQGFDPLAYVRMARTNGLGRAAKTLGRKVLGIDRKYREELLRQIGTSVAAQRRLRLLQMDASRLNFDDESFDFVYSFTVFQHLSDPATALEEVIRVLRPGGGAYIDLMPYTGPNASLDIRILGGAEADVPRWAHLRPRYADRVRSSAFLNGLRLTEWKELFDRLMPGVVVELHQPDAATRVAEVDELHAAGELLEYGEEELITTDAAFIWKKPEGAS